MATSEASAQPSDVHLQEYCNLGYAIGCSNLPAKREADAVRFSVAGCANGRVTLHYVCESGHRPRQHGTLEFVKHEQRWSIPHTDVCIQRMAECYLDSYLRKTDTPDLAAVSAADFVSQTT